MIERRVALALLALLGAVLLALFVAPRSGRAQPADGAHVAPPPRPPLT